MPPVEVRIRISRLQRTLLLAFFALAAATFGAGEMGLMVQAVAFCFLLGYLRLAWQVARPAIECIRADGEGCAIYRDEAWHAVQVQPESVVWPWLIVLHAREQRNGARLRVVLWPDSAHPEQLRRLRAWLRWRFERWQAQQQAQEQDPL
jgi:hypothetical protein